MAYPTFSKAGMTTLTFSRGYVFPFRKVLRFNQRVVYAENRQVVRVVSFGPPEEIHYLPFELLPLADYQALRAWLLHVSVYGSLGTFTYTDHASVAYLVRWWPQGEAVFDMPEVANTLYNIEIPLRLEAA